jgi:UDP-3-O-[3-hydroxymyristoyl] glucosamine N-acyltransferase
MTTSIPLAQIAALIGGELIGDPQASICGVCSLEEPQPTHLAFTKESHPRTLTPLLAQLPVRALIVSARVDREILPAAGNFILAANPLAAMVKAITLFFPSEKGSGKISQKADIHPSAAIAPGVTVGPFVAIAEDVVIEEGVIIHPHVTIYRGAHIGKGCIIHAHAVVREHCRLEAGAILQNGAVIGADGFGYVNESSTGLPVITKVPQVGIAVLGPCSEVGANSCVDRAALGTTQIGAHTKLDNLVQVGHNTKIGPYCFLCGQVGVSGSCKIGTGVVLGGNVGVADHMTIADGVRLGAKSGVINDIEEKGDFAGHPTVHALTWRRQQKALAEVADIITDLKKIVSTKKEQ